jgi:hypothetical protein
MKHLAARTLARGSLSTSGILKVASVADIVDREGQAPQWLDLQFDRLLAVPDRTSTLSTNVQLQPMYRDTGTKVATLIHSNSSNYTRDPFFA